MKHVVAKKRNATIECWTCQKKEKNTSGLVIDASEQPNFQMIRFSFYITLLYVKYLTWRE